MPCIARLFYDLLERAALLGGFYFAHYVPRPYIVMKRALRRHPARRNRINPCVYVVMGNGNFSKKIVRHF